MNKLLEFGRRALFYVRVLSGYEERRIRSYRLELEQHLRLAQQRKEAVKKIPEQLVLSEVRRMVDEMQELNKSLENMEADINEYFKPIDKEVESIINLQIEKDKATKEMMGDMYKLAMLEKIAAEEAAELNSIKKAKTETMRTMFKQALVEKAEAEAATENQTKASSPTQTKSQMR